MALTQLSALPTYEKLFNPSHKKILSQKIKKPEQIEHEKVIAPMLEQKGKNFQEHIWIRLC